VIRLSAAWRELLAEGFSLVLYKDHRRLYASAEDGMRPLLAAIDAVGLPGLEGVSVVDKVVGKAAALLIAHICASEVYAGLISEKGQALLRRRGITTEADTVVPEICDMTGQALCPFERLVDGTDDPSEGYRLIRERVRELSTHSVTRSTGASP
jgi:hypothetical protein